MPGGRRRRKQLPGTTTTISVGRFDCRKASLYTHVFYYRPVPPLLLCFEFLSHTHTHTLMFFFLFFFSLGGFVTSSCVRTKTHPFQTRFVTFVRSRQNAFIASFFFCKCSSKRQQQSDHVRYPTTSLRFSTIVSTRPLGSLARFE